MSSGLAVVPGAIRTSTEETEEPEKEEETPVLYPEEQRKKRSKARQTEDRKGVKAWGAEVTYETRGAKMGKLKAKNGLINPTFSCAFCGTQVESKSVAEGKVQDFVETYLGTLRIPGGVPGKEYVSDILKFERQCHECGLLIKGNVKIMILDERIEEEKSKRYKDSFTEEFGSVLKIKAEIKNGKFPRSAYYRAPFSNEEEKPVPIGLRYWCGSCGQFGFPKELSKLFAKLCKRIDEMFLSEEQTYNEKFNVKFRCRRCSNEMKIEGIIEVNIPTERGAAIEAYKAWQRDAYTLILQKGALPKLVDWNTLAVAYAKIEKEKTKGKGR